MGQRDEGILEISPEEAEDRLEEAREKLDQEYERPIMKFSGYSRVLGHLNYFIEHCPDDELRKEAKSLRAWTKEAIEDTRQELIKEFERRG